MRIKRASAVLLYLKVVNGGFMVGRLYKMHIMLGVLLAAVLGALALIEVGTEPEPVWECSPVNPYAEALPAKPCFRAILTSENLLTLEWRVVNSDPNVYIYSDFVSSRNEEGFRAALCKSKFDDGCETSLRVGEGGNYRWQLMVESPGKDSRIHVPFSITIPGPLAPLAVRGGGMIDQLAPTSHTFSWEVDPGNHWPEDNAEAGWIELRRTDSVLWSPTRYPRSGPGASYAVPASEFKAPASFSYAIRDCHIPAGGTVSFCSPSKKVGFHVGSDHFLGDKLIHARTGDELEVSFTSGSGDLRMLASSTLIPASYGLPVVATRESSYTIDSTLLTPGVHTLELVSCNWLTRTCSNRQEADRATNAGMLEQMPSAYYRQGDLIATIRAEDGSVIQSIYAPASGHVYFENSEDGQSVEAGAFIAHIITESSDHLYIMVDSPVDWIRERDYSYDFQSIIAHNVIGRGLGLDVVYDDAGGIWLLNEFSNSIEHVKPGGKVESLTVPLARNLLPMSKAYAVVRPFAIQFGDNKATQTSITSLAERVTRIDGKIWFTQGGGLLNSAAGAVKNHSRIISFDPALTDTPATLYDDRFCVYNVPADDAGGAGNNQVIGLTGIRDRIWIAEIRGLFDAEPSSISSFIPNPYACANLLNFDDPAALANQYLQYCSLGRTPEQDGCIQRYLLNTLPAGIKVAHLAADESNGTIWFTDAHGKYLGNLNPGSETPFKIYPIPDFHPQAFRGIPGFGGFPWSLRANHHAIYIAEYLTHHILRFDKASASFDEIRIPYTSNHVTLHSIDIDSATDRLWFTLSIEAEVPPSTATSKIGYIDLASWRDYMEDPDQTSSISAVIYRGMDKTSAAEDKAAMHQAFRGVAVDPASGKIAIAEMWRGQIIELTPNAGFWP
jgi:hypothetical protein